MFRPIFWLESSTHIFCLVYYGLRCRVLTRFIQRYLLIRICNWIPHSLKLQCKSNGIRSLRNKMFWSFVFGIMALTILKQMLLNFNTFNHFKVVKCPHIVETSPCEVDLITRTFIYLETLKTQRFTSTVSFTGLSRCCFLFNILYCHVISNN